MTTQPQAAPATQAPAPNTNPNPNQNSGPNPNAIYSVNWYPNQYPKEGEAVQVQLVRVDEMGIWVQLLEYGGKEGMIPIGQYTTRKSRRVPKSIHVGTTIVALITQVDEEKNNMDLTRQGLKDEDVTATNQRFNDYKSLMNLLNYVAWSTKNPLQKLVSEVAYPLHEQFGNAYQALTSSSSNQDILNNLKCSQDVKDAISVQMLRMAAPQEIRVHSEFEAEVTTKDGVEALRAALISGYDEAPETNLSITVTAPPLYSASITTMGDQAGLDTLNRVVKKIEDNIIKANGRFLLKTAPKAVTQHDMQQIQQQLDEIAQGSEMVDIDAAENEV